MQYYRINTDRDARTDKIKTCDIWYEKQMAFAGDYTGNEGRHANIFKFIQKGDGIFMHNSKDGIIGFGIVKDNWDKKHYKLKDMLLYNPNNLPDKETTEYRIAVYWLPECDLRHNPLPINRHLPYAGPWSRVSNTIWKPEEIIRKLKLRKNKV